MTLLSWPQKSCLVEIRNGFWRYAGLGEDSANSVQQRVKRCAGVPAWPLRPGSCVAVGGVIKAPHSHSVRAGTPLRGVVYAQGVSRNSRKKDQSRHRLEEKSLKI